MVETALNEKEQVREPAIVTSIAYYYMFYQAEVREQQCQHELIRARKMLAAFFDEAGAKTRAEVSAVHAVLVKITVLLFQVESVRDRYNKNIDKMAQEIDLLEKVL